MIHMNHGVCTVGITPVPAQKPHRSTDHPHHYTSHGRRVYALLAPWPVNFKEMKTTISCEPAVEAHLCNKKFSSRTRQSGNNRPCAGQTSPPRLLH